MHQQNEQPRLPPKSKPKATKSTAKKKNNQQPAAPASAIEAMMARMHAKMVEVRLPPESSMRLFELLQKASETAEMVRLWTKLLGNVFDIFRQSRALMSVQT